MDDPLIGRDILSFADGGENVTCVPRMDSADSDSLTLYVSLCASATTDLATPMSRLGNEFMAGLGSAPDPTPPPKLQNRLLSEREQWS
jgi:hypothetical protein